MTEHTRIYDRDIREPLTLFLEQTYGRIRVLEEMAIGTSRADLVMVAGDKLIGIEIKSDADTYARLHRQIPDYDRFFDENIIAVGSSHALHVEEHVPAHWGIITIDPPEVAGCIDCYLLRKPKPSPNRDRFLKLLLLWRPELSRIQEKHELPAYKQKSKRFVEEKLIEKLPPEVLDHEIAQALFERDYTKIGEEIRAYRAAAGKKPRRKKTVRRAAAKARRAVKKVLKR